MILCNVIINSQGALQVSLTRMTDLQLISVMAI